MGKKLHMTVHFRSHDLFGAYGLNLAGCCLWLVEEAARLGVEPGTVTCLSTSAHVYDRDWEKAEAVVEKAPRPALRWDQRSVWRVEIVETPDATDTPPSWDSAEFDNWKQRQIRGLRAVALAADGQGAVIDAMKPIAVIEADTPGALRLAIERSGLITSIGGALWLGWEIERIWSTK